MCTYSTNKHSKHINYNIYTCNTLQLSTYIHTYIYIHTYVLLKLICCSVLSGQQLVHRDVFASTKDKVDSIIGWWISYIHTVHTYIHAYLRNIYIFTYIHTIQCFHLLLKNHIYVIHTYLNTYLHTYIHTLVKVVAATTNLDGSKMGDAFGLKGTYDLFPENSGDYDVRALCRVCMYVCMYSCVCTVYVCMHACTYSCVCMYVFLHTYMYVCMYVRRSHQRLKVL